ncbi:MAG: GNAT family N-acetyltransferase [Nocardioidaceae bacterium]
MDIEQVDPLDLDGRVAERLAEIANAADATDSAVHVPVSGPSLLAQARFTFENRPYDGMWLAHDRPGALIGYATLEVSSWDNLDTGVVFCHVHPDHRGSGVGSGLLAAQELELRKHERSKAMTFLLRDSPGERFLVSHGWEVGQHTSQRRLVLADLDRVNLGVLMREAAERAGDYELVPVDGPVSEDLLPDLQALYEAINDAPLDDLDSEPEAFPPERVNAASQSMEARGQHVYRLMARHRESGEWAGHTILCVDTLMPGMAYQEDTSVIGSHRGHRLGVLLKATMLEWMLDVEPELATIDTWNADTNDHMIAVNEMLGSRVINRESVVQGHIR